MRRYLLIMALLGGILQVNGQVNPDQNMIQLATQYYNSRDFERAAPLLKEIYEVSANRHYFRLYISSLTEMQRYREAEDDIRREIRKSRDPQPDLLVHWGYILKQQKNDAEASEKFTEALQVIPPNRNSYINTANNFIQWREFEWAEKLYLKGRESVPGEAFHSELANVYLYLRNYTRMLEELLLLVKQDEKQLPRVQSNLTSAMYMDVENGLRDEFRNSILKKIQSEPQVIAYNRLLIWFLLQERQFSAALKQYIALDRRTGTEEQNILAMAQVATNNHHYQEAVTAYDYILAKGENSPAWLQGFIYKLHADYHYFTQSEAGNTEYGKNLAGRFELGLEKIGYSATHIFLIREYAHLLAFYLDDPDKAIQVLEKALAIPGLRPLESGEIKTELADVYVYSGDPWEAILLYSQVIDANRNNNLGDDVKFRKARLGYFLGNFSWARAQLDVLRASTSKLIANDAMQLSLFISGNSGQDTTEQALLSFARADLLFFRNKTEKAMAVLDSIAIQFSWHSLMDDVLFRKANIFLRLNQPALAAEHLERIDREFSRDLLADDALYLLAETYNFQLKDLKKAAETYKKILFDHPGSIYVTDAREKFRALTGSSGESNPNPDIPATDQRLFDGKI